MTSRLTFLLLSVLVLLASPALAASCGAQEQALRDIKLKEWPAYYRSGDAEGLRRFLLDDFQIIGGDGSLSSKTEEVAWVSKESWNPKEFVYSITSVRCPSPGTAIIVGEGSFLVIVDGVWHRNRYVSSNVLVLDGGRWRPASSHISGEKSERVAG